MITLESYDNYKEKLQMSVIWNKAAHFEFEKRLSENIVNNSTSFYSYVKSKQRSKDKIGPLKNDRWDIIMKDEQMWTLKLLFSFGLHQRRCWKCSHFTADVSWNRKWQNTRYHNQKGYVAKKLEELNSNESQGPDEIHLKLLKELSSVIAALLAKLF